MNQPYATLMLMLLSALPKMYGVQYFTKIMFMQLHIHLFDMHFYILKYQTQQNVKMDNSAIKDN